MSEKYLNIYEIKSKLSHYAREVMRGKRFVLAMRNRPFAELIPLQDRQNPNKLVFGVLKGKFTVPHNFNNPLKEFEKSFYGD